MVWLKLSDDMVSRCLRVVLAFWSAAWAAWTLSECGRAAQYAKIIERIRMVKEVMSRLSRIHCLGRFVDVILRLRIDLAGGWTEDVLEVVSVLGLGLLKFSFTGFLVSGTVVVDLGGGGKYIGACTFLGERPALNEGSMVNFLSFICVLS